MYLCPPASCVSLPPILTPLGYYRAQFEFPESQQIPTGCLFSGGHGEGGGGSSAQSHGETTRSWPALSLSSRRLGADSEAGDVHINMSWSLGPCIRADSVTFSLWPHRQQLEPHWIWLEGSHPLRTVWGGVASASQFAQHSPCFSSGSLGKPQRLRTTGLMGQPDLRP